MGLGVQLSGQVLHILIVKLKWVNAVLYFEQYLSVSSHSVISALFLLPLLLAVDISFNKGIFVFLMKSVKTFR